MSAALAEHGHDQIRRAVHHYVLTLETRRAVDPRHQFDDPSHTIQRTQFLAQIRQQIEGRQARCLITVFLTQIAADLAGKTDLAVAGRGPCPAINTRPAACTVVT